MGKLRQSTAKIQEILDESSKIISGENLKTVNGQSLLGKGNLEIQGGGGSAPRVTDFSSDFNKDF